MQLVAVIPSLVLLLFGVRLIQGGVPQRMERRTELARPSSGDNTSCSCSDTPSGRDGRDGRDGLPGLPGLSVAGPPGRDGKDGENGRDGERGERGEPGIQGPTGPPGPTSGGVIYTRWGRTTCRDTLGTELLYEGITAGSHYNQHGGGVNYLCLPEEPEYASTYQPGGQDQNFLHGAEYQTWNAGPLHSLVDDNIPCAVCYVSMREVVLMLPARLTCPPNWTLEYNGYLMSERYNHKHGSTFECVDINPESIPGSDPNTDGALFHFNEASCNGIPCPPYDTQREITCAVCSK